MNRMTNQMVGKKIVDIRPLTKRETEDMGWEYSRVNPTPVIVLDDGTIIIASRDAEGNGPGSLQVIAKDGHCFTFGFSS